MFAFAAFVVVAILVATSPGPDTALVRGAATGRGCAAALAGAAGVVCGLLVWAVLVSTQASLASVDQVAAIALRVASGVYLASIGIWSLRQQNGIRLPIPAETRLKTATFLQGFAGNLLNAKVGLLYLSLLPVFVTPGQAVFIGHLKLASVHAAASLLWLSVMAIGGARHSRLQAIPQVTRDLRLAIGTSLVSLAAELGGAFASAIGGQAGTSALSSAEGVTAVGAVLALEQTGHAPTPPNLCEERRRSSPSLSRPDTGRTILISRRCPEQRCADPGSLAAYGRPLAARTACDLQRARGVAGPNE
jgi:threonine/homoserine/homoserine lactone efflux protein